MSDSRNIKYGVNMKKYCAEYETYIQKALAAQAELDALLHLHELKIRWLQHERLVHLIVTLLISIVFLFSIYLFIVLANPFVLALVVIVLALLGAYISHYFFLENTVQYWYKLYDSIYEKQGQ